MSRSRKKEKTKPHCKVLGCGVCEEIRLSKARNRAYKIKKAKGEE